MSEPIKVNIDTFQFTIAEDLIRVVVDDKDKGIFHCQYFHLMNLRGISITENYPVYAPEGFDFINKFDLVLIEKERNYSFSFHEKWKSQIEGLFSTICMVVLDSPKLDI